jgi:DNA-binding CsgD family transcriptional regulator
MGDYPERRTARTTLRTESGPIPQELEHEPSFRGTRGSAPVNPQWHPQSRPRYHLTLMPKTVVVPPGSETQNQNQDPVATDSETRVEQAEARTAQAKTRIELAETRTGQAETRTEQAETRTEQAETRTESAKTRAEQAEARTEQAETRTELAETRTAQAESALQRAVNKQLPLRAIADPNSPVEDLTGRQREILQLIAEGQNTKQIAELLKVSPKTVEYHRTKLMDFLNIHDVPGLVRYAIRVGLLQQEKLIMG